MIRIIPYDNVPASSNEFVLQQGERCTIMVSRLDGNDSVGEVFAFVQIKAEGPLATLADDTCQIDYEPDNPPSLCRFTSVATLDTNQPGVTVEAADGPATYRVVRQQCTPIIAVYRTELKSDVPDCPEGQEADETYLLRPVGGASEGTFTLTRNMLPARISAWANGDPFEVKLYSVATICGTTYEVPLGDCNGLLDIDNAATGLTLPGEYKWEVITSEVLIGDPVIFLDADDGWHCNECGGGT